MSIAIEGSGFGNGFNNGGFGSFGAFNGFGFGSGFAKSNDPDRNKSGDRTGNRNGPGSPGSAGATFQHRQDSSRTKKELGYKPHTVG